MSNIFGVNEKAEKVESSIYAGHQLIDYSGWLVDKIYAGDKVLPEELDCDEKPTFNEYFTIVEGSKSVLARYDPVLGTIERITKQTAYGVTPRNAEQTMALDMLLDPEIPLITLTGIAGTGKTLLALAAGLECSRDYHTIHLSRPIVPLGGKEMGHLPGDANDKIGPYMMPLYDNLSVIRRGLHPNSKEASRLKRMQDEEKIIIEPLAFLRGRSLHKAFMIIDEAQNLTPIEVKTIVTRAGEGTKIVFTGDTEQVDIRGVKSGQDGLSDLVMKFKGQKLYGHINLVKGERSALSALAAKLL
jgi:PhoH-like ATPase